MFQVIKTEGRARRGIFECAHGTVQTPVFMNVGTLGAIKGAVSAHDLKEIGCQVELSNTYHLHLRPGDHRPGAAKCGDPRPSGPGAPHGGAGPRRRAEHRLLPHQFHPLAGAAVVH